MKIKSFIIIFFAFIVSVSANSQSEVSYRPGFLQYIKQAENGIRAGWNGSRWYPHASFEGGAKTIAYGHKIVKGEDFSRGLTEAEATALLIRDLRHHEVRAAALILKKHDVKWESLNIDQREILLDYEFNGVLIYFPKFRAAVLSGDNAGMLREYKRYAKDSRGKRHELKDRNTRFYSRYLKGK